MYRDDSRVAAKHAEGLSVARPAVLYKWAAEWAGHCTGPRGTSSECEQGGSKGGNRGARSWLVESAAGWHRFVRVRTLVIFCTASSSLFTGLAVLGLQVLSLARLAGLVGLVVWPGQKRRDPRALFVGPKAHFPSVQLFSGVRCSVRFVGPVGTWDGRWSL